MTSQTRAGAYLRDRLGQLGFELAGGYWTLPGRDEINDALCDEQPGLVQKKIAACQAQRSRGANQRVGVPMPIQPVLTEIVQEMSNAIEVVPDKPRTPCPKERPDEICTGTTHHSQATEKRESRQCPLLSYLKARGELTAALAKAGYTSQRDPKREPVHQVLLRDLRTDYEGPSQALRHARRLGELGFGNGYNVLLHGDVGLGKTRIALALLFWALWENKSACRVTSPELLRVAIGQASFDKDAQDEAAKTIKRWQSHAVLLFDDLGTRDERQNDQIFAALSSILDDFAGQMITTTNLTGDRAGDAFVRVKSRLLANREIKGRTLPAVSIHFDGPDQRRA